MYTSVEGKCPYLTGLTVIMKVKECDVQIESDTRYIDGLFDTTELKNIWNLGDYWYLYSQIIWKCLLQILKSELGT